MLVGEDPENFVGKPLADVGHAVAVEQHGAEALHAGEHTLGLRARHQILVAVDGQAQRHHRLVERELVRGCVLVEDCGQASGAGVRVAHHHRGSHGVAGVVEQDVLASMQVREREAA